MQLQLAQYWQMLKKQINGRSQRERVLLLVTGVVIIWTLMFNIFITPFSHIIDASSEEKSNGEDQYNSTRHELALLQEKAKKQKAPESSVEFQHVNTILSEQYQKLEEYRHKLLSPEQAPHLLESLLKDFSGLTLLGIETLPALDLMNQNEEKGQTTSLYRQAIRMTFVGEYQDLLAYVRKIESLPYPLWWQALEYKVTQFPQAKMVLTVYTLSEHMNWIGV